MAYIEASAAGKDNRILDHLEITGGTTADGEKCWIVSKEFESENHSPDEMVFLVPDELDELGKYVTDCLEADLKGEESERSESEAN
jgi:hypothetical protein